MGKLQLFRCFSLTAHEVKQKKETRDRTKQFPLELQRLQNQLIGMEAQNDDLKKKLTEAFKRSQWQKTQHEEAEDRLKNHLLEAEDKIQQLETVLQKSLLECKEHEKKETTQFCLKPDLKSSYFTIELILASITISIFMSCIYIFYKSLAEDKI